MLKNGKTLHKGFGMPLKFGVQGDTSWIEENSLSERELIETEVILIDEISMVSKQTIEFINDYLKSITKSEEIFGGKIVITGGDFRQILPVIPNAGKSEIINNSIIRSELWNFFIPFQLKINMRANDNQFFSKWQLEIGEHNEPVLLNVHQLSSNIVKTTFPMLFNRNIHQQNQQNDMEMEKNDENNGADTS